VLQGLGRFGLVLALIMVFVTFSVWEPSSFFTWNNVRSTFDQQAIILMVAFGAMLTLTVGEFDLSIGANAGAAMIATVGLTQNQGLNPWLAIICAIAISSLIGLINGLVVTQLKVNSFVATLGMASLLAGLTELYTGNVDINTAPVALTNIGRSSLFGITVQVWAAVATAIVLLTVLQKLRVGREFVAVGSNRRASELTGIRVVPRILLTFTLGGTVAGIGGALYGSEVGSAALSTGASLLLPAFAGAFLGATAITPGRYNVLGTITGVLLLAFTVGGLQEVGVAPWISSAVQGVALIVAVGLSAWAVRLRSSRLRRAQLGLLAAEDVTASGGATLESHATASPNGHSAPEQVGLDSMD
jgi:ribose transport system permease protein